MADTQTMTELELRADRNRRRKEQQQSNRDTPGTEHHYLLHFRHRADFGPAHEAVVRQMDLAYIEKYGGLPAGWDCCNSCGEEHWACSCRHNPIRDALASKS